MTTLATALIVVLTSAALEQTSALKLPQTQPSQVQPAKPEAQPPQAPAKAPQPPPIVNNSVLLLTFQGLGPKDNAWVGEAIRQNLYNELSGARQIKPMAPAQNAEPTADADQARKAAQSAGAAYVLFGTFQVSGSELRVTGQILDSRTGKLAGAIRATGQLRDLFDIEDNLADQVRRALATPGRTVAAKPATPPATAQTQQTSSPFWNAQDNNIWAERTFGRGPTYDREYDRSLYWYNQSPGFIYGSPYYYGYPDYGYYGFYWGPYWPYRRIFPGAPAINNPGPNAASTYNRTRTQPPANVARPLPRRNQQPYSPNTVQPRSGTALASSPD